MIPEVNLNVKSEEGTSTILFGTANTPEKPKKLIIIGNFQSVGSFIKSKLAAANSFQEIKAENAIVTCDVEHLTIKLETNPNDVYATEVTGTAEFSDELAQFGVNQNKFYNREQLIKLFRFNRRFFPNKEENQKLITAYQSFKASVSKEFSVDSDQRGNHNVNSNKVVKTGLPEEFILAIPIFKGGETATFPVEICIEENDSGCRFWFESIELAELIEKRKEKLFKEEVKHCDGLTIIYK